MTYRLLFFVAVAIVRAMSENENSQAATLTFTVSGEREGDKTTIKCTGEVVANKNEMIGTGTFTANFKHITITTLTDPTPQVLDSEKALEDMAEEYLQEPDNYEVQLDCSGYTKLVPESVGIGFDNETLKAIVTAVENN